LASDACAGIASGLQIGGVSAGARTAVNAD